MTHTIRLDRVQTGKRVVTSKHRPARQQRALIHSRSFFVVAFPFFGERPDLLSCHSHFDVLLHLRNLTALSAAATEIRDITATAGVFQFGCLQKWSGALSFLISWICLEKKDSPQGNCDYFLFKSEFYINDKPMHL